jgi:hypothetical protein
MKITPWNNDDRSDQTLLLPGDGPSRTISFVSGSMLGGGVGGGGPQSSDTTKPAKDRPAPPPPQFFDFGTEVVHSMKYEINEPGGKVINAMIHYGGDLPYAQWFNLREQLVLCMVDSNKTVVRMSQGLASLEEEKKSSQAANPLFGKMFHTNVLDSITNAFSRRRVHIGRAFVEVLHEILVLDTYCRRNQGMQKDLHSIERRANKKERGQTQHTPSLSSSSSSSSAPTTLRQRKPSVAGAVARKETAEKASNHNSDSRLNIASSLTFTSPSAMGLFCGLVFFWFLGLVLFWFFSSSKL